MTNYTVKLPFAKLTFKNASNKHIKYLNTQFFESTYSDSPKVELTVTFEKIDGSSFSKNVADTYFFENPYLYVKDSRGALCQFKPIDTSSSLSIKVDPNFDLYYLYSHILEPSYIIALLNQDGITLHSSSVADKSGVGHIFLAWQHTGKTELLLKLTEKEFTFMSDDYTVIMEKKVFSYPKLINLFSYNFKENRKLLGNLNLLDKLSITISSTLTSTLKKSSMFFSGSLNKVLYRLSQLSEVATNKKISPLELGIETAIEAANYHLYLLQRHNLKKLTKAQISKNNLIATATSIIMYELTEYWNLVDIYNYFSDSYLFSRSDFEQKYAKILSSVLSSKQYSVLFINPEKKERNIDSLLEKQ